MARTSTRVVGSNFGKGTLYKITLVAIGIKSNQTNPIPTVTAINLLLLLHVEDEELTTRSEREREGWLRFIVDC